MKKIILFESEDGIIFNSESKCELYEHYMNRINELQNEYLCGIFPNLSLFSQIDKNYCFPWNHKIENVKTAWKKFMKIVSEFSKDFNVSIEISDNTTPKTFRGYKFTDRFDKNNKDYPCIYLTWNRFLSIDMETGKEYLNKHLLDLNKNKKET